MFNFDEIEEFYPTPETLLKKIFDGVKWGYIKYILEPSAGKGDILDYISAHENTGWNHREMDLDCIELDDNLQKILVGKGYHLVGDDFLKFNTYKHYDLIVMNPPFSKGASHLLKALELVKDGGNVICIINSETIKNPYSNERKMLTNKLEELNASIEYFEEEFSTAERKSSVEIAVVKVAIEEKVKESFIWDNLKTKTIYEKISNNPTDIVTSDFIKATVLHYEKEVEAGINLINEYKALCPYILNTLDSNNKYAKPLIDLRVGGHELYTINDYIMLVRAKYWDALFADKRFTGQMTSEQRDTYRQKVNELKNYDFSYFNIKTIQEQMCHNLVRGIENCIYDLFDELSRQYSYSAYGTDKNIHYYNGWKTNKSWYINSKVILPFINAWGNYSNSYRPTDYRLMEKLHDIENALNYLDGGRTFSLRSIESILLEAENIHKTKNIEMKYFNVTFYKKGTMHIEFTNLELLKKLNIFGAQGKKWLPPSYGHAHYDEMTSEEKAVIDEFEGAEEYKKTVANADYYIYNPKNSISMIEVAS